MKNNTCIIQTISSESVVIKEHKSFTIFSIKCDDELKRSINDTCKNKDCVSNFENMCLIDKLDCALRE